MAPDEFSGQVVVITGASGFIGRQTAAAFAAGGAAIGCLDIADTGPVVENLMRSGADAFGVTVDLVDEAGAAQAFDQILEWQGRVDVLVNMAGLYYNIPRVPFWEIDVDTWNAVIDSNLRNAFLCARAASAPMREAGRGRIVNLSSNTAVFGMANFMHYDAAKAGIVGMTRAMARELGPFGIGVNAVAPGLVRTEGGTKALAPEYWDQVVAGQCLRTPIEVDDVVNAVTFLSGKASRAITGQTLLVNAGATMGAF